MELTPNLFPSEILEICHKFSSSGFKAFVVGGSIRDLLRGETRPNDWDIATDASPSEVMDLFTHFRVIPTGIQHGTVTLLFKNLSIEITTFRVEGVYKDGRRPSEVQFVTDIGEDLARRDLTINAIAYDPITEEFTDPYNGRSDINNQLLRLVGDPDARLGEDGLRLIRIFRFVSELGYSVENSSLAAVPRHLDVFDQVAKERIGTELQKLMSGRYWQQAVHFLHTTGVLAKLIPQFNTEFMHTLISGLGLSRLEITFRIIDNLTNNSSVNLRFSVLIHQLSATDYKLSHAVPKLDKKLIIGILKGLKFPNKQIDDIIHILTIYSVPLPYSTLAPEISKNYALRKFLFRIDPRFLEDYLNFIKAWKLLGNEADPIEALLKDIKLRSASQSPIYLKDLKINGNDVVAYLNIDKTKAIQREFIGICLTLLREQVEVKPSLNSKKELYEILNRIKMVVNLCTALKIPKINIISTDHIRKLYRMNKPNYSTWESTHTYRLAIWLISCHLRRNKSNVVFFDGTNFNSPSHPNHRENLIKQFRVFNPIFVHINVSKEALKLNFDARGQEEESLTKSDADLSIFVRYEKLIRTYESSLYVPSKSHVVELSTRSDNYDLKVKNLVSMINKNNHRLIIMSGNVLTGKTFTAKKIKDMLNVSS
ncbi:hypothetical protein CEE45_14185 [Candidatus Heimdallarchaeota archaeon B3_Heim]|nr:MAG: hypothetical protein CEE45_14185 [Candidatus Heimdallarchaeota archaeon B3_Heim]